MKRISAVATMLALTLLFSYADTGLCRDKVNLYNALRKKKAVNVCVSYVIDSTDEKKIDVAGLKRELADALALRKSINFKVVPDAKDADILIECDVVKYYWASEDPIDMIVSAGAIAYDALSVENYSYMEAVFTVRNKRGAQLWSKKEKIDLTKRNMSRKDSLAMINQRAVKIFIRDCFSKKRSKPKPPL